MLGIPAQGAKVRNTVARWVAKELRTARLEVSTLLKEAGLDRAQLGQEDGWITYRSHALLLDAAARAFDDPYYGLNVARRIEPREFGALIYVGLSSATLGEALRNFERYLRVQSEAWRVEILSSGDIVTVTSNPVQSDFAHFVQATEAGVALFVNSYQHFLGQRLRPIEIGFIHALTPHRKRSRVEELLSCPVAFGRNRIQLKLHERSMHLPIKTADDRLLKVLKAHCAEVLKEQKSRQADLSSAVSSCIADGLSKGRAKASLVAAELGLTERSLHRRLALEGSHFGDILDRLRHSLAEQYLRERKLSGKQIAFLLGYASQSSFGAAYRRWTGHAPRATETRAGQAGSPRQNSC